MIAQESIKVSVSEKDLFEIFLQEGLNLLTKTIPDIRGRITAKNESLKIQLIEEPGGCLGLNFQCEIKSTFGNHIKQEIMPSLSFDISSVTNILISKALELKKVKPEANIETPIQGKINYIVGKLNRDAEKEALSFEFSIKYKETDAHK